MVLQSPMLSEMGTETAGFDLVIPRLHATNGDFSQSLADAIPVWYIP